MISCSPSCLTLCSPMDCSPPGSSVHGIFQARILKRVALSFSRGSSWLGSNPRLPHWQALFRATRKPVIPFVCSSLQAFSVLPNIDSFKVSELFYRLSFSWFGLMVSSWLDSCWMLFTGKKNWQYCVLLSLSCWRHMMKLCPITGDVKFHPWWSFPRSLHCKASFSPLLSVIIYGGSWGLWRFCSQPY